MSSKMKIILSFLFFLLSVNFSNAQSIIVSAKYLKSIPDSSIIYIGALWCSPCIEKQNMLEDSLLNRNINYYTFYDGMSFSPEKKLKLIRNNKDQLLLILDPKYYESKAMINFVSPKKAIKRFYVDLQNENFNIVKERNLWFGDCIIKLGNNLTIISGEKILKTDFVNLILKSIDKEQ